MRHLYLVLIVVGAIAGIGCSKKQQQQQQAAYPYSTVQQPCTPTCVGGPASIKIATAPGVPPLVAGNPPPPSTAIAAKLRAAMGTKYAVDSNGALVPAGGGSSDPAAIHVARLQDAPSGNSASGSLAGESDLGSGSVRERIARAMASQGQDGSSAAGSGSPKFESFVPSENISQLNLNNDSNDTSGLPASGGVGSAR